MASTVWAFSAVAYYRSASPYSAFTPLQLDADPWGDRPEPRNARRGDEFFSIDARLARTFRLGGSRSLTGFVEGFNVTNHTSFGGFIGNVQSSLFGMPTTAPKRRTQVGVRLDSGSAARIVLAAAKGMTNAAIAAELNTDREYVGRWRDRFAEKRLSGIDRDAPRPGRKKAIHPATVRKVIRLVTTTTPPNRTHWTTRSLARVTGISFKSVHRILQSQQLKPHRVRKFKISNDPQFIEKVTNIIGLYLNPPEHALVLCADEKSQIQALDRTQRPLPLKKGRATTATHDYRRHGTTTLFAAIELLTGTVVGECMPRHRHQEWLKFLKRIDEQMPADLELHLIADNYATHKHPAVKKWLANHPRFHMHFTPTSASWLNLIERFFADLANGRIRRGTFGSVPELIAAIESYIEHHNHYPTTFTWTAKVEDVLNRVARARKALDMTASE